MNPTEQQLRIAVADDEADMRLFFRELLPYLGHEVVAEAATGRELVDRCRTTHPDLVITDVKMPDLDGIAAAAEANRDRRVPVILITAYHDGDALARAGQDYIMAYLAKPVKPVDLGAAVHLAMLRFAQVQAKSRETADLQQALEDRKLIERAKGAVMRRLILDEDEAYVRLRRLASARNRKMIDVVRELLAAEEVFRSLEKG